MAREVAVYQSRAFAPRTQQSYRSHRKSYVNFCASLGYSAVPASSHLICCYVAFLARKLKFKSIQQYLNIVRIMHREWDLPNPLVNNFSVTQTLRGVRRTLGDATVAKLPITPEILITIERSLDRNKPFDAGIWAICLVLFYGLLRKGSIMPLRRGLELNQSARVLLRSDVTFSPAGACLNVRHTKTIQYAERSLKIPLPPLHGSPLCPVRAILRAFALTPGVPPTSPAFSSQCGASVVPITCAQFDARLRICLEQANLPAHRFSGHSFRRGGATWAYQVGIPAETIRSLGDWRSSCYLRYVSVNTGTLRGAVSKMQHAIVNH